MKNDIHVHIEYIHEQDLIYGVREHRIVRDIGSVRGNTNKVMYT